MHNIKFIRENFEFFKKKLIDRNVNIDSDEIIELDKKNRNLIQKKENLEKEKKIISKTKDKSLFSKSKEISKDIEILNNDQITIKNKLDNVLKSIPNLPLDDVPVGADDNSNVEIERKGKVKSYDFQVKSHFELGEKLRMLDFDLASKTTGSRFVFVKGLLAKMERALANFMGSSWVNWEVNSYLVWIGFNFLVLRLMCPCLLFAFPIMKKRLNLVTAP